MIRSLTTNGDGTWEIGTGGGITVRSDVHEEQAECWWKAERLLRVFDTPAQEAEVGCRREPRHPTPS